MGVALVTPFTTDGAVDYPALETLCEHIITSGANFICVLGTTAETPTLEDDEKQRIMDLVVRINRKRVPLLLGAGSYCTAQVCARLKTINPNDFDGVLIVTPYYNKPTQEGLYQHFKAVSEASPLPVVLYNVPGRTGDNMLAETTLRLARDFENIVAIKEASGNLDQIDEIIEGAPEGFEVISGDDSITIELIGRGGVGVISVIGNAFPKEFTEAVSAARQGNYNATMAWQTHTHKLLKLLFTDGNPAGIKALLHTQGKAQNVLRLPLVPVREETYRQIASQAKRI